MKKKRSLKSLKKEAWRVFSEWVRKRGADERGINTCVTCGVKLAWEKLHGGHYLHGHSRQSFLREENVNPQCMKCNYFLSGNLLEYHEFMLKTYGQEKINELKRLSKQVWKPTREELEQLIAKYKGVENE